MTRAEPRVPPQNIEAEESVLGALMVSEAVAGPVFVDVGLRAEDFHRGSHRLIFEAARGLYERGAPLDAISVCGELERRAELDQAGGKDAVAHLASVVPVAGNAAHYAAIVLDNAKLRRTLTAARSIQTEIHERQLDAREAVSRLESAAYELLADHGGDDSRSLEELMVEHTARIDARQRGEDNEGVHSPWAGLNAKLGALRPGNLVVVAARPAEGKSTFALNLGEYVARTQERSVAFFSLEMSDEEVAEKLLAARARVDSMRQRGRLERAELERIAAQSERLAEVPMLVNTRSQQELVGIRTQAQRFGARQARLGRPLGLVIVDYLQLLTPPAEEQRSNRTQQISALSRGFKVLAGQLKVPIVIVSQLNREVERQSRKPILSDLRDSGQIEADANVVLFLHGPRDDGADEGAWPTDARRASNSNSAAERTLIVAKNRNGPKGELKLAFDETHSLWLSRERAPVG